MYTIVFTNYYSYIFHLLSLFLELDLVYIPMFVSLTASAEECWVTVHSPFHTENAQMVSHLYYYLKIKVINIYQKHLTENCLKMHNFLQFTFIFILFGIASELHGALSVKRLSWCSGHSECLCRRVPFPDQRMTNTDTTSPTFHPCTPTTITNNLHTAYIHHSHHVYCQSCSSGHHSSWPALADQWLTSCPQVDRLVANKWPSSGWPGADQWFA